MAGLRPTDVDVRIGARITEARRAARLVQRQVATAIGVSAAQLQKYEKGTNRISGIALAIIADLTGVPIAAFFDAPGPQGGGPEPTVPQARDALCAAAEAYFAAKHRAGEQPGASMITFAAVAA